MNLFDLLDDFIIDKIYHLVWLMKMKYVLNEIKTTIPFIITSHGGIYFYIGYIKELKKSFRQ